MNAKIRSFNEINGLAFKSDRLQFITSARPLICDRHNGPLVEVSDFDTRGKVAALLEELRHASAGCAQLLAEPGVGNLEAPHMAAPEHLLSATSQIAASVSWTLMTRSELKASFQIIPEQRYAVSRSFLSYRRILVTEGVRRQRFELAI